MKIYKRCEENWKPIPGINYQNLFYPLSFCYNKMKMLNNKEPLGRVTGSNQLLKWTQMALQSLLSYKYFKSYQYFYILYMLRTFALL